MVLGQVRDQTWYIIWNRTLLAAHGQVLDDLWNDVGDQIKEQVRYRDQVRDRAWDQAAEMVHGSV